MIDSNRSLKIIGRNRYPGASMNSWYGRCSAKTTMLFTSFVRHVFLEQIKETAAAARKPNLHEFGKL